MLQSAPKTTQLWNYHKQDEEAGVGGMKKNENTHSAAYIRGQECQLRKQFCMEEIGALAPLRVVQRDRKQINSLAMKKELERQIRQKKQKQNNCSFWWRRQRQGGKELASIYLTGGLPVRIRLE